MVEDNDFKNPEEEVKAIPFETEPEEAVNPPVQIDD
jgi:hypothetical protein